MSDLALKAMPNGSFDLDFDEKSNDLLLTDSLFNAVGISIGTYARDRKARPGIAVLDPQIGGWWADALDPVGTLGGYLYEAFPGKLTAATAESVKVLVIEALHWMIDDGVAKSVSCEAVVGDESLDLTVVIEKPDGVSEDYRYELNWIATNGI